MTMFTRICKVRAAGFVRDESGAVTVDWVVLTAAICGMGVMLFMSLTPAVFEHAGTVIAGDIERAAQRP